MKIVCISDTHNLHHKIDLPYGDVLIHAGDATMRGRVNEVENFLRWMENLPHPIKIFVAGNHDFLFDKKRTTSYNESERLLKEIAPSVIYLKDSSYTLPNGAVVYGTPWVNGLEEWAFGWKSPDGMEAEFASIPEETEILVSHSPAFGTLDQLYTLRLGSEQLANRIAQLGKLRLHVHGHIHHSYGATNYKVPLTVNVALCTENYTIDNPPIVLEYTDDEIHLDG